MTGLTTYGAGVVLRWATGVAAPPALSNAQIALFTSLGNDDGTGFNEVSGLAYARAPTTAAHWNPPTSSKPLQVSNALSIAFPVAASNWGTVLGFGLYDSNNDLLWFDYTGNFAWRPFTAAVGANGIFSSPGHGLVNGDQIALTGEYGGLMPSSPVQLTSLQTVAGATADTFTIGATITVSGTGMLRKVLPVNVPLSQSPVLNPGALVLQLA